MVMMKFIMPNTTPLFLAAFRLLPAGLLILLVTVLLKLPQPKTWQAWGWISLFALINGAMFQGFLTEGLVTTGAGLGAVLIDAQPLVVALLSRFLFGELIGTWGWLGLAIGIAGICLCGLPAAWIYGLLHNVGVSLPFATETLFRSGEQLFESQPVVASGLNLPNLLHSGELLMLLSALAMSFGTIIIRYVKKHVDPIVATGWHMIFGGIPLIILSFLWENQQISRLQTPDWAALAYATIFGTAVTYGIFFYLAAVGNITSVSALIFLTPVFALLFSGLFLGEQLTNLQWIGVVFTLISVYLVVQREEIAKKFASGKVPIIEANNLDSSDSATQAPGAMTIVPEPLAVNNTPLDQE